MSGKSKRAAFGHNLTPDGKPARPRPGTLPGAAAILRDSLRRIPASQDRNAQLNRAQRPEVGAEHDQLLRNLAAFGESGAAARLFSPLGVPSLSIVPIKKDGNCTFRSVSHSALRGRAPRGSPFTWQSIRKAAAMACLFLAEAAGGADEKLEFIALSKAAAAGGEYESLDESLFLIFAWLLGCAIVVIRAPVRGDGTYFSLADGGQSSIGLWTEYTPSAARGAFPALPVESPPPFASRSPILLAYYEAAEPNNTPHVNCVVWNWGSTTKGKGGGGGK